MGGGMSGGGGGRGRGGRGPYFKGTSGSKSQRNLTIHAGRQEKHIFGEHNYVEGRSRFAGTVKDAQALVDQFAGKGTKITPNKERVDFGKVIGKYCHLETGKYYDTTVGTIRYSKKGTHIVPAKPNNWKGD